MSEVAQSTHNTTQGQESHGLQPSDISGATAVQGARTDNTDDGPNPLKAGSFISPDGNSKQKTPLVAVPGSEWNIKVSSEQRKQKRKDFKVAREKALDETYVNRVPNNSLKRAFIESKFWQINSRTLSLNVQHRHQVRRTQARTPLNRR
jgi:hypothetical protein